MTDKIKPGIVFMGTPRFAVPSLEMLVEKGYPVRAVVTAADKPSGRGLRIRESEIKTAAKKYNLPVLQPGNLKDDSFVARLRDLSADIFVVVAFRMLPEKVWRIPPLGTINLHASLLPDYRGAAPINHAIINGEKVTGVTTFVIEKEIDTGKILLQERVGVDEYETAGSLHDKLMFTGAKLLIRTIEAIIEGTVTPLSQHEIEPPGIIPAAPKLSREDCRIDWSVPAGKIFDFVRGLSPYPGAWTRMITKEKRFTIKILEVIIHSGSHSYDPGKVMITDQELLVAAGEGFLSIRKVQPEGKKVMPGMDFFRGIRSSQDVLFE